MIVAHFDRFGTDDEIAIDSVANFSWQGSEAWLAPNRFCSGGWIHGCDGVCLTVRSESFSIRVPTIEDDMCL